MIVCEKRHLEARCQERGYTLGEVMACVISQKGDIWTVDPDHPAYPRPKRGLGDMVEGVLKSVGITEERVSKVLGKPCGCKERKKRLNSLGERLGIGRVTPGEDRNK
jgi:hypothetical protein